MTDTAATAALRRNPLRTAGTAAPFCLAAILLAATLPSAVAQTPEEPAGSGASDASVTYTPSSLAVELRELAASLSNDGMQPDRIPEDWLVETGDGTSRVSTGPLRALLTRDRLADDIDAEELAPDPAAAQAWLSHLADRLDDYAAGPADGGISASLARNRLEEILARPEFANADEPSQWELFRQRIANWITNFINRLLSYAAGHPTASRALFWVAIAAAIAFLGMWLWRMARHEAGYAPLPMPELTEPERRSWQAWFRAAREAASRDDAREAIRCSYWAGVGWLQARGALPARLTATPRECVGLLASGSGGFLEAQAGPENAGTARYAEPLANLTRALERVWYGGRPASPGDVAASFRELEALGCRLD